MAFELQILALTTVFFMLAWIPAFVARYRVHGLSGLSSDRPDASAPPLPEWGERARSAYANLKESYPAFAVAVLLLAFTGGYTDATWFAAMLYLVARVLHLGAAIAGIVWLRTACWATGFLATLFLLVMGLAGVIFF